MIPVKAIFFDLDGTLIDSQQDLANSVGYLQQSYSRPVSHAEEVAGFVGDGMVKLVERALPGFAGAQLEEAIGRFKDFYSKHCLDNTRLYDGAVDMLQHFRDKKLAVITNKPERISRRMLEALGVAGNFQLVLGGDSLERKKPDPLPVVHALLKLGSLSPKEAVMVGDDTNDVLAGRGAGVWTARVPSTISHNRQKHREKPDIELKQLSDLTRFFI